MIILSFSLITFILVGSTSVAHATVRFYFNITLTDSCGGAYNGYYDLQVVITANGSPIGTATCSSILKGGPTCYSFDYNIGPASSDGIYGIIVVGAQRHGGTCQTPINQSYGSNSWYWNDFLSCVHSFSVVVH